MGTVVPILVRSISMAKGKLSDVETAEIMDIARVTAAMKGYVETSDYSKLINRKIERGEIEPSNRTWYLYKIKYWLGREGWHQEAVAGRKPSRFYPPDLSPTSRRNTELRRLYERIHPMNRFGQT
jgi:hypothetical protein